MTLWHRLFSRKRLDTKLEEELRAHLRMATKDRIGRGESSSDAAGNLQILAPPPRVPSCRR